MDPWHGLVSMIESCITISKGQPVKLSCARLANMPAFYKVSARICITQTGSARQGPQNTVVLHLHDLTVKKLATLGLQLRADNTVSTPLPQAVQSRGYRPEWKTRPSTGVAREQEHRS